jgi:DNA-binding MurR/RpiR family transcriptional regulator
MVSSRWAAGRRFAKLTPLKASAPVSASAIHELLNGANRGFSRQQKVLVNFLYRNYQKVAFMSITELARETKVSEATIVRLAYLLGFDGYPTFQKAVQRIVAQELTAIGRMQLSLEQNELDHPMQRVLKTDMHNLMRLYRNVPVDEIEKIVSLILAADRIVVAGFMASAPLAQHLGYTLNRALRNVAFFSEDGLPLKRAIFELGRKDLLIAFAFPRYPASLINAVKRASEGKVRCVGLTDSGASPLAALTSPCVFLPGELIAFVDSAAAPLSFVSGLVAEVVKRDPRRTAKGLEEFESLAERFQLFHHED